MHAANTMHTGAKIAAELVDVLGDAEVVAGPAEPVVVVVPVGAEEVVVGAGAPVVVGEGTVVVPVVATSRETE